ncbi:MAG: TRAP transporter small permease [Rhodobacteraceae bacterium]|jgi:TRAP-type C4-dicarboxylate transport system permease small subunit|nr:TRAP transporter small permease [Paracoccaceae bacterium]
MTLLEKTLIAMASIIVALMVLLMNVEVFLRYAFNSSTNLSEEYSGYMFAAATVLAFVPALMRGRFLRISALLSAMPMRMRAVVELLVGIISAGFCLVLTTQTWALFQTSLQFGSVSDQFSATPLAYPQAILAPALLALSVAMIVRGATVAQNLWRGRADLIAEEENVVD